jgi:hypothetical protein
MDISEEEKNNFYFKHIDLKYHDHEIEAFNKKFLTYKDCFLLLPIEEVKECLPSVFEWFEKNNISEVRTVCLIGHRASTNQAIHTDVMSGCLAINIFLTPESSEAVTRFYKTKDNITSGIAIGKVDDKISYNYFAKSNLDFVTCYKAENPVLLNVKQIHGIVNYTSAYRASLSFRFVEDPWHLIKD